MAFGELLNQLLISQSAPGLRPIEERMSMLLAEAGTLESILRAQNVQGRADALGQTLTTPIQSQFGGRFTTPGTQVAGGSFQTPITPQQGGRFETPLELVGGTVLKSGPKGQDPEEVSLDKIRDVMLERLELEKGPENITEKDVDSLPKMSGRKDALVFNEQAVRLFLRDFVRSTFGGNLKDEFSEIIEEGGRKELSDFMKEHKKQIKTFSDITGIGKRGGFLGTIKNRDDAFKEQNFQQFLDDFEPL